MAASFSRDERLEKRLLAGGRVTAADIARAKQHPAVSGEGLGRALEALGLITEMDFLEVVAEEAGTEAMNLAREELDWALAEAVSFELCLRYRAVPVRLEGKTVVVAMKDPGDLHAIDDLRFRLGTRVRAVVAGERAIREALTRIFPEEAARHLAQEDAVIHEAQTRGLLPVIDNRAEVEARIRSRYLEYLEAGGAQGDGTGHELPHEYLAAVRLVHELLGTCAVEGQTHVRADLFPRRVAVRFRSEERWAEPVSLPAALALWVLFHWKTLCGLPVGLVRRPTHASFGLPLSDGGGQWFRVFFVPVRDGHVVLAQRVPPEVDLGPEALFEPRSPRLAGWWSLFERSLESQAAGELEAAETELVEAAAAAEEAGEVGRLALGDTLILLAQVVDGAGRLDDARALYERALSVKQEVLGVDSPLLVSCLTGLGETAVRQGQFDVAEAQLRAALTRVELAYGAEDLEAAWLLERVGRACAAQGRTAEAEASQTEAENLVRELLQIKPGEILYR